MRGYYPPALADWWMDDWISRVYGRCRTLRLHWVKVDHAQVARRYGIDGRNKRFLAPLVRAGRARVFERAIVSVEAAAAARALAPAEAHEAEETKLEFLFDDFGGDVATLFDVRAPGGKGRSAV